MNKQPAEHAVHWYSLHFGIGGNICMGPYPSHEAAVADMQANGWNSIFIWPQAAEQPAEQAAAPGLSTRQAIDALQATLEAQARRMDDLWSSQPQLFIPTVPAAPTPTPRDAACELREAAERFAAAERAERLVAVSMDGLNNYQGALWTLKAAENDLIKAARRYGSPDRPI